MGRVGYGLDVKGYGWREFTNIAGKKIFKPPRHGDTKSHEEFPHSPLTIHDSLPLLADPSSSFSNHRIHRGVSQRALRLV
jgi:hypothetical protein